MTLKQLVPVMSLGLSEDKFNISLGFSTEVYQLGARWLDEEIIDTVVDVEDFDDSVRFSYQSDHKVLVDKKTGLLLEDSWPDPSRPGPRKIVLEKYSPLDIEVPYSEIIPGFQNIEFEETSQQQWTKQIMISFLTDLGRQLSDLDRLEELLDQYSDAIDATMREFGRRTLFKDADELGNNEMTKEIIKEVLLPAYGEFKEKYPHISFSDFLKIMKKVFEENTDAVEEFLPAETADIVDVFKGEYELIFDELPEDARKPLRKIYDASIPPLVEGYKLGYFYIIIEQAERLDLEKVR